MPMPDPQPPPGVTCWICLEEGPDDAGEPLVRNCACRGEQSAGHVSCIAGYARTKSEAAARKLEEAGMPPDGSFAVPWECCPNCMQKYQGRLGAALSEAFVESVRHLPETHYRHFTALMNLARSRYKLSICDGADGAEDLYRHLLEVVGSNKSRRPSFEGDIYFYGIADLYEEEILSGLAAVFEHRNQLDEALQWHERARAFAVSKQMGPLMEQEHHVRIDRLKDRMGLRDPQERIEFERQEVERKARRLGKEHYHALQARNVLIASLYSEQRFLEAMKLGKETLETSKRVLGPDHENTALLMELLDTVKTEYALRLRAGALVIRKAKLSHQSKPGVEMDVELSGIKNAKDGTCVATFYNSGETKQHPVRNDALIFCGGTPVICHGLKSAQHLNGKQGTIRTFDKEKKRYVVEFKDGDSSKMLVKRENLRILFSLDGS